VRLFEGLDPGRVVVGDEHASILTTAAVSAPAS
jgi:hypothetical protein